MTKLNAPWEMRSHCGTLTVYDGNGDAVCDDESYYPRAVRLDHAIAMVAAINAAEPLRNALQALASLCEAAPRFLNPAGMSEVAQARQEAVRAAWDALEHHGCLT